MAYMNDVEYVWIQLEGRKASCAFLMKTRRALAWQSEMEDKGDCGAKEKAWREVEEMERGERRKRR